MSENEVVETLCFSCTKACGHVCSWADEFEPVDGWCAVKTKNSYRVITCPYFDNDVITGEDGQRHTDRCKHPSMDTQGMFNMLEAALHRTRDDYILGIGGASEWRTKHMTPADNRQLIEKQIRSSWFKEIFNIENPDAIIKVFRLKVAQLYQTNRGEI